MSAGRREKGLVCSVRRQVDRRKGRHEGRRRSGGYLIRVEVSSGCLGWNFFLAPAATWLMLVVSDEVTNRRRSVYRHGATAAQPVYELPIIYGPVPKG